MDRDTPVKYFGDRYHRWHEIVRREPGDITEAMNVRGGVLVRSCLECSGDGCGISTSVSLTFVPELSVVQQWQAIAADGADIEVYRKIYLEREANLIDDESKGNGGLLIGSTKPRFRIFSADESMARPEPALVRAVVDGTSKTAPNELEVIRLELMELRYELSNAEDLAKNYKMQRDHLLGGLSWDLATADNPISTEDE